MEAEYPTLFPAVAATPLRTQLAHGSTPTPPLHTASTPHNDYVHSAESSAESATEPSVAVREQREESHSMQSWVEGGTTPSLPAGRRHSQGSHESHSLSDGRDHDMEMLSSSRSVDHSDVHSRSQLATELDLRTVVTASSVISGEHSVDGCVPFSPFSPFPPLLINLLPAESFRSCSTLLCGPPAPNFVYSSSTSLVPSAPKPSPVPSRTRCSTSAAPMPLISSQRNVPFFPFPSAFAGLTLLHLVDPCSVINYVARSKEMGSYFSSSLSCLRNSPIFPRSGQHARHPW
jgi:hypothetical protein